MGSIPTESTTFMKPQAVILILTALGFALIATGFFIFHLRSQKAIRRRNSHRELLDQEDSLYTLQEFIEQVKSGGFIDYDGFGYYSDGKYQYPTEEVYPSTVAAGKINRKFSHVVWFNK